MDGTIEIGGDTISNIDLSNVEEIAGDLKLFNSSSVTDVMLNKVKTISGSLEIQGYTQLFTVDLSALNEVNELSFVSLPSFSTLNLNTGVSKASSIEVSDTALHSLDNLIDVSTIDTLNINNNKNVSSFDLPLQSVGENLILSFNSDDCEVKLDELKWASNLTVQDVGSLSAGNLTSVNGSLVLGYNTFDSLELKKLRSVGASVRIFANDEMTKVDLSKLTTIGGELRMFNNTELTDLGETFSNLSTVKGAVNIDGDIGNFSLPNLKSIAGDFSFVSTNDDFDCSDLNKQSKQNKIEGHNYNCTAPKKASSSSSSKGSKSSSGSSSSSGGSGSDSSSSSSKKSGAAGLLGSVSLGSVVMGSVLALIV